MKRASRWLLMSAVVASGLALVAGRSTLGLTIHPPRPPLPQHLEVGGQVLDEHGDPVPQARVALRATGARPHREVEISTGQTNPDGSFAISGDSGDLEPFQWAIQVDADGFARAGLRIPGAGGKLIERFDLGLVVIHRGQALQVKLVDGEGSLSGYRDAGVFFEALVRGWEPVGTEPVEAEATSFGELRFSNLGPGEHVVSVFADGMMVASRWIVLPAERIEIPLPAAVPVNGRVVDERGEAIANLRLDLESTRYPYPDLPMSGSPARTDAQGRFELFVPKGPGVQLGIRGSEFVETFVRVVDRGRLVLEKPEEVEIRLQRAARLRGRVVDAREAPVSGADIFLRRRNGRHHMGFTDDAGEFSFDGLVPGDYRLFARHEGYERGGSVEVPLGVGANELTLRLVAGEPDPRQRRVKATLIITNSEGAPVENAYASVFSEDNVFQWKDQRSDSQGRVVLTNVPFDRYRLGVRHPDYNRSFPEWFLVGEDSEVVPVVVKTETPVGFLVSGRVVDESGRGVIGASLTLLRATRNGQRYFLATSGKDGAFSKRVSNAGKFEITVAASGFAPQELRAALEPDVEPLTLLLRRGVVLEGPLLGLPEWARSRATLTAIGKGSVPGSIVGSNYRVGPLSKGIWRLELRIDRATVGESRVSVGEEPYDQPSPAVEVPAFRSVWGRITVNGEALRPGHVSIHGGPRLGYQSSSPDAFGGYFLGSLAEGERQMTVDAPMGRFLVDLPPHGDVKLDLEEETGIVRGRVVDDTTGQPVSGVSVQLFHSQFPVNDGWTSVASSERSGEFQFEPMFRRPMTLSVNHRGFERFQLPLEIGEDTEVEVRLIPAD